MTIHDHIDALLPDLHKLAGDRGPIEAEYIRETINRLNMIQYTLILDRDRSQ